MQPNPSWKKSDPRHWLVPWLEENRSRVERAVGMKITRPLTEPYGCGTYGCVYPLDDPRYVIKFSDDPYEGPLVRTVIDIRKRLGGGTGYGPSKVLPGIVFYRNLFVDTSLGTDTFIVVREEIVPFTYDDVLEMQWYWHPTKFEPTNPLDVTVDVIDPFFESKDPDEIRAALEQWLVWVQLVAEDLPLVGDAMLQLFDSDIVLRDVHWGNVGKTTVDWGKKYRPPGSVVIHDLGLTLTEAGGIPKLNPTGADEQRQKVVGNLITRALTDLFREHNMKALPSDTRYDKRQIEGWPDVWFTMQGETKRTKPWIRVNWKSTGETWGAELLHGKHPREPKRVH